MEGFLRYDFGGLILEELIHGGAYFQIFTVYKCQRAKKVVSDSQGLVDFAIGLVIFVLNLPHR